MRVFDVCGTLYNSNTTFDFIIEYHRYRNNKVRSFYLMILLSFPCKVLNKLKLFSIRKRMIATLKGEEKKHLATYSEKFVTHVLSSKEKKVPMELLSSDKDSSLLISASIDPVISAIAEHLNVRAYSSLLEFDAHNKCTGRLSYDLKGVKSEKIDTSNIDLVATDNMTDIDIIKHSKIAYIIVNNNNKQKWEGFLLQHKVELSKVIFI